MVGEIAAVLTGAVFAVAAVSKLSAMPNWLTQSGAFGVPKNIARLVPVVELAVGALAVARVGRRQVAWVAVALLVVFTALLTRELAQGRRPVCACFGSWSAKPIGPSVLVRNACCIALALVAALA